MDGCVDGCVRACRLICMFVNLEIPRTDNRHLLQVVALGLFLGEFYV